MVSCLGFAKGFFVPETFNGHISGLGVAVQRMGPALHSGHYRLGYRVVWRMALSPRGGEGMDCGHAAGKEGTARM